MNDIAEPTPSVYVLFSVERSEATAVAVCESETKAMFVARDVDKKVGGEFWERDPLGNLDLVQDGEDDPDTGAWWTGWRIRKVEMGVPFA